MMKKRVMLLFLILMILSLDHSMFISLGEQGSQQYDQPIYEYGPIPGDEYIYTAKINVSGGFNNFSVYDEIGKWLNSSFIEELLEYLPDFLPDDYFGRITNFYQAFQNLTHLINQQVQLNLTIQDLYREQFTESTEQQIIKQDYDKINTSILLRENESSEWKEPYIYGQDSIDLLADFAKYTLLWHPGDVDFFTEGVQQNLNESGNDVNWNNQEIQRIQSNYEVYLPNGTLYNPSIHDPNYDPQEPVPPLSNFQISGYPFFLPLNFKFNEWLTYTENQINYNLSQEEVHLNNDTTIEIPAENFNQAKNNMGITSLSSNPHGIGIIFNSDDLNQSFANSIIIDLQNQIESLEEAFEQVGISEYFFLFHSAVEYDEKMALASFATYYDIDLVFDTTTIISNSTEIPYLNNELFHLSGVSSIIQNGYSIPTKIQIEEGEIGDHRIISQGFWKFLRSIPSYPLLLLNFIALVTLFTILQFYQKNRLDFTPKSLLKS